MIFQRSACRVPGIAPSEGLNLFLDVLQPGGNVLDEQVGHCLEAPLISFFQQERLALKYVGTQHECSASELHSGAL
jgi:hypothetical protein